MIEITSHAYLRAKERLSLTRSAFTKLANTAFDKGLRHSEMKGHLKKYVSQEYRKYHSANTILVYGENIFFFNNHMLITVYQLPVDLRKLARLPRN